MKDNNTCRTIALSVHSFGLTSLTLTSLELLHPFPWQDHLESVSFSKQSSPQATKKAQSTDSLRILFQTLLGAWQKNSSHMNEELPFPPRSWPSLPDNTNIRGKHLLWACMRTRDHTATSSWHCKSNCDKDRSSRDSNSNCHWCSTSPRYPWLLLRLVVAASAGFSAAAGCSLYSKQETKAPRQHSVKVINPN